MIAKHPVIDAFELGEATAEEGFFRNFLGVRTRRSYCKATTKLHEVIDRMSSQSPVRPDPAVDQESYFEWIDLFESVVEAKDRFTIVELGAGWGRWLVNAAFAARQREIRDVHLVGVDGEPTHYKWMRQHFVDNGLDPDAHTLIHGAVSDRDGTCWFEVGHAGEWYGQRIPPEKPRRRFGILRRPNYEWTDPQTGETHRYRPHLRRIRQLRLDTLLEPSARVDFMHVDIQGAEHDVLAASREVLDRKVARVHIETHSDEVEVQLRELFSGIGWTAVWDFAQNTRNQTPYGEMLFVGGLQTWRNPRL